MCDTKDGWANTEDDNSGTWYYYEDGGVTTGWNYINDNWYYFNDDGEMVTGWFNDEKGDWYYLNSDGTMATGWVKGVDAWYFLYNNGSMAHNYTDDGYHVNLSGRMVTGNGWKYVDCWWYYLSDDKVVTGWLYDKGNWYYLYPQGSMAEDTTVYGYYVNASGEWVNNADDRKTGWIQKDSGWYYYNSDGKMATGWLQYGDRWYYSDEDGKMQTGWVQDNGNWYYLNSSGAMETGWIQYGDSWYYFDENGKMKTGWIKDNGYSYYLKDDGTMAHDTTIDGYYLKDSGEWGADEDDESDNSNLYVNGYYDRDAAVTYATNPDYSSPDKNEPMFSDYIEEKFSALDIRKHTRKYNTEYERYDNYDYYAKGHGKGSDCANFISQVLKAGGVKETDDWNFKWENDYGPYGTVSRTPISTTSWIRPQEQLDYLQSNGYINGDLITINSIDDMKNAVENDGIQVGDPMFFENEKEGIHHSTVITQIGDDGIIYYSAHSNDRINEPVKDDTVDGETIIIAKMKD